MTRHFIIEKEGLPDLAGMMLATVEALKELGGSATIHELDEHIIDAEGMGEEEQSYPMPNDENRPRVNYYLAWARTYLKRGDALENSTRGVWALTETGNAIENKSQTHAIWERVTTEEKERARTKRFLTSEKKKARLEKKQAGANTMTGDLFLGTGEENPDSKDEWKNTLLDAVMDMTPDGFERLSQRLLREAGFTKVEVRGKTGDGGIDGVGVLRVNLVSFQVYFQRKRWKGSVGSKEIRDFRGALQGRADKGLFITTGRFTSSASDEATRDGAIAIDLIDGDRLCDLLKENNLGVSTAMIEKVHIDAKWFEGV